MYRFSWRAFFESFLPVGVLRRIDARRRRMSRAERDVRVADGHIHVVPEKGRRR